MHKGYPIKPGQIDDLPRKSNYPVVNVTWHDARVFCRWVNEELLSGIEQYISCQARLPSEAEWEKAARGTDGREYPWSDQQPDESLCNYDWNVKNITPVGHYSPLGDSPYGCADMAGNVWEWTHSLYRSYPYSQLDGRENESTSGERVVRGGSIYNYSNFMRCAYRATNDPDRYYSSRGFRLCVSPLQF